MKDVVLSTDGTPICYEVHGAGAPALVFVHGWSCDRSYWSPQVRHFAVRHQVVAVDLAGHGESGVGRQAWTMPAFGEDVTAVVERLRLESVVMIGHSMGGDVIVEAALDLSRRVAGLVLVDVYSSFEDPSTHEEIQEFIVPFRQDFIASFGGCSCPARMQTWSIGSPRICRLPLRRSRSTPWSMPSAMRKPSSWVWQDWGRRSWPLTPTIGRPTSNRSDATE
jgi:pimeloyl-ACP methyl ester carboxylesterase